MYTRCGILWTRIIAEAHGSRYTIHTGSTKIYYDLKEMFWWDGMKKHTSEYMAKYSYCQHVKDEHLKLGGLTRIIEVLTRKWEAINMDFVVGIPKTRRQHDFIWVIMERMTKSVHFIPVKSTYRPRTMEYSTLMKL